MVNFLSRIFINFLSSVSVERVPHAVGDSIRGLDAEKRFGLFLDNVRDVFFTCFRFRYDLCTGSCPTELGNLEALKSLYLNDNKLSGEFFTKFVFDISNDECFPRVACAC